MLPTVWQDFSFAVRQFRRNLGFTISVILTLALGIGACTAIFSVADGVLFRPLPFPHSERLLAINTLEFPRGVAPTNTNAAYRLANSYPDFLDWQQQNHTFEALASWVPEERLFSKLDGQNARVMPAARVSANLFTVLGVAPVLGRNFIGEDDQPGHWLVILSYALWKSDFAASPAVIGQTVKISDRMYTVVGVMPSGFHYPIDEPAQFWATFAADREVATSFISLRSADRISVVGRLKRGTGLSQALAELNTVQRGLAQQYQEEQYRMGVTVTPLLENSVSEVRSGLLLLLAAVGMVLIIGCANVAGLLLARSNARRPELALRSALGASRWRVVRQLLLESLLLALAGGVTGILLSFALLRAALRFIPSDLPRMYNIAIDGRVLGFALVLSAATALVFGLLPAWKISMLAPVESLREGGYTSTSGHRSGRFRNSLVVAETALGFTLLIGSGLLIRSMVNVLAIEPGFDTQHTVAFDIALTQARYPDPSKLYFFDKLLPQLAALPGVEKVSIGHPVPFSSPWFSWKEFTIPGHTYASDDLPNARTAAVEPGYFETLSIPLVRGRSFAQRDNSATSAPVVIINQSLARQYFPGEDPIGRFLVPHPGPGSPRQPLIAREIVGIVGNTRTSELWEPYHPEFFLPYAQDVTHQRPIVVLKVVGDPASYQNAVGRIVSNIDKDAPVFGYRTFAEELQRQAAQPRFQAILISGFAFIALLLSAVGLYTVLSYLVSEKTRELGLRMALGASRSHILRLVLGRGLVLACFGIVIGALASLLMTRFIADDLFHVTSLDRSVFVSTALVLSAVSMVATFIPAWRATQVDPMRTLREQ